MLMGVILYFGGLFSLVLGFYYILNMLMSLEYMMLSLFIIIIMMCYDASYEVFMIYMVFSVCEASLGLGLLVMGIMNGGNYYFSSYDILKW